MSITYNNDHTIIALCTPRGAGALALIRLSGSQAFEIADQWCSLSSGQRIAAVPTHTIHYGTIRDHHTIDRVMVIVMHAPRTFTGEHTVEITCHNNPFIIERILELAITHGARLAQEGEFSRRAFLNNKIDLVQAEALNDLIHAQTQQALKLSLSQLSGTLSHWIARIEQDIFKAIAFCEASFEFIDEEITFDHHLRTIVSQVLQEIGTLRKTYPAQQHIRQGIRIALIGPVNAGKSSLFNALLNRNRAIVSPIAGTTRDALESGVYKNGRHITLVDTAGLRHTDDVIEKEGIARSYEQAHAADIMVLALDGSREMTKEEYSLYQELVAHHQEKIILVMTKADIATDSEARSLSLPHALPAIKVSVVTKEGIEVFEQQLEQKIEALFNHAASPFLLTQRQLTLLHDLENKMASVQTMMEKTVAYELVSHELKDALAVMSELTGKTISEQGMDVIFKQFCVGK